MKRTIGSALALMMFATACANGPIDASAIPELDLTTPGEVTALLLTSEQPVVLNVWASWCIPCRSEAPLLLEAHAAFGDEVRFIGVDVRDTQDGARRFIAEFGLSVFPHFFDPNSSVPGNLGAQGVPLTFFFEPGGALSYVHRGVIDERTLAVHLDELTR